MDNGQANPYPSQIDVQNLSEPISDVNVKLGDFIRDFPDDADVLLIGPQGQKALLMTDTGGNFPLVDFGNVNLTLDDEATESLPDDAEIFAGTYKPTQGTPTDVIGDNAAPANFPAPAPTGPYATSLSVFHGTDPHPDTTAPDVISTMPQAGATGVSPTANIRAIFSEDMQPSTINGTTIKFFKKGSTTKVVAS